MRQGVAKRVSQFVPTGSSYFDSGYKAGWEAAKKYYTQGEDMPVPEGQITTSDLWKGEKKDDMPAVPESSTPQQATGPEASAETTH